MSGIVILYRVAMTLLLLSSLTFSRRSLRILAQLTPKNDNVCTYSFTVPSWTPSSSSSSVASTGVTCGTAVDGAAAVEHRQLISELQATVKILQQQLAAQQTQLAAQQTDNAAARRELATLTQLVSASAVQGRMTSSAGEQPRTKETTGDESTGSKTYTNTSQRSSPGGATYVRWGRTMCPNNTQLLYKGIAAGNDHLQTGGGSNTLCLPDDPQWGTVIEGLQNHRTYIYGAEYELSQSQGYTNNLPFSFANNGERNIHDNNAPCALCHSPTRSSHVMMPARTACVEGWTKEYGGYLVSEHFTHKGRGQFLCLDEAPEVVAGGGASTNGALFYPVQGVCGTLPCPKYVEGWELTCVVCTK